MSKLFFILCVIGGCQRWFVQEQKKAAATIAEVKESKKVLRQWFIGDALARDVVRFEIRAIEGGGQLSEIYSKEVRSFWEITSPCSSEHDNCPPPIQKEGQCTAYYRDYIGEEERFIDLSKRKEWPFKVTVGGVSYPLDTGFSFEQDNLSATLMITKKMLEAGNDLAIVMTKKDEGNARVGFIGHDKDCEGSGMPGFSIENKDYQIIDPGKWHWLEVSVTKQQKKVIVAQGIKAQVVFDQWFAGDVVAGDVLHLEIQAAKETRQFGDIYTKNVLSSWESSHCFRYFDGEIHCLEWIEHVGQCLAYYREVKEIQQAPIVLLEQSRWPFTVTVGGVPYPLEDDFSFESATLYATLRVTKEMLERGNDLVIAAHQQQSMERVGVLEIWRRQRM